MVQRIFKIYPHDNNVEQYRLTVDVSQKELAQQVTALGRRRFGKNYTVSKQTINAIETHRYDASFGLMMLIAEALKEERKTIFVFKDER